MKKLPLSQGKFALVDDQDYRNLSKWKWTFQPPCYAKRVVFFGRNQKPQSKSILLHRVIMNPQKGTVVDHIDGNGLNNQRSNLRIATHAQNHQNTGIMSTNTSGYKNISWSKQHNKWRVRFMANKKEIHIGRFDRIGDAVKAYNKAVSKYHGEFAILNTEIK